RAVVGSSLLLPGPGNATHSDSVQWEFRSGRSSPGTLQHRGGARPPATPGPSAGRALLHPSKGSLALENVQERDSGTYRVTVGTGAGKSLEMRLEALQPMSRPRLWASALQARATGKIVCEVAEGRVATLAWKKDGRPLPAGSVSQLSGGRSVLHLRPAQRPDCGSYSCNASNGISWQESSLEVTVEGVT
ncbi:HECA2 protein, partial [Pteruthius melanotis]|nr:HECA2 protein [Pteruthius melanotis]